MPTRPKEQDRPRLADLSARTLEDDPSDRREAAQVLGSFFKSVTGLKAEVD